MAKTLLQRFNEKYITEPNSGCWLWVASCSGGTGYGQINLGRRGEGMRQAHKVAYELFVGPVPEGLELDHKCRVRSCVNPDHLEPVTHLENMMRGDLPRVQRERHAARTHCKSGHEFSTSNTRYKTKSGYRVRICRACHIDYMAKYYTRNKA